DIWHMISSFLFCGKTNPSCPLSYSRDAAQFLRRKVYIMGDPGVYFTALDLSPCGGKVIMGYDNGTLGVIDLSNDQVSRYDLDETVAGQAVIAVRCANDGTVSGAFEHEHGVFF